MLRTLLLLLLLTGCAAAGRGEPAELTRASDLPDDQRAIVSAYLAGGEEWRRVRAELKQDPPRARWMCENLALELFRAYDAADLAPLGERRGPFERARDELIDFGALAVPVLVGLLAARDGVVPVVTADVLRRIGEPATLPVAALLDHAEWRPRRAAAELLGELPHAGEDEEALEARLARLAREDAEWIVRAQAARSLGLRGAGHVTPAPARDGLLPVLADPDPAVAREAAAALAVLGDPAATPALLNYLERSERAADARAQQAAVAALRAVTGARVRGGARAWREFWVDHRGALLQPPPDRPY